MKRCPKCNSKNDGDTHLQDPEKTPKPGDFTMCVYCQSFFVFNEDLTVREPTEEDWEEKEKKQPGFKQYVMRVKKASTNVMLKRSEKNN